jgi:multiple sugar transport system permease protein
LIFETIYKLRVFDLIVTLTGGGPGVDTTPLGLLVHRLFFRYFQGGHASAISVVLLLVGAVITLIYVRFVYREVKY